ncbi:MAG: hypothetical protein IJG55_12265 [Synergistaceae bacterium]|nr:hypothetical protein [Synergistaceae bacterium]
MLMHTLDSVQAILQAWEDITDDLDAIHEEISHRIELKIYNNDDERKQLDELAETLDDLIDWRMFYKL